MLDTSNDESFGNWQAFCSEGKLNAAVRPIIARSWQRCRELYGLNPWSVVPSSDFAKLKEARAAYKEHLPIISPIVEYIKVLLEANGLIADERGFVYELVSPIKNYPRSLGTFQTEKMIGTFSVTITLEERIPSRVDGYEHYLIMAHNRSTASAPVFDQQQRFIGVLSAVGAFKKLPPRALECIQYFAEWMRYRLIYNQSMEYGYVQKGIDTCQEGILVLKNDGTIFAINTVLQKLLHVEKWSSAQMENVAMLLFDAKQVDLLTNMSLEGNQERIIAFKNFGDKGVKEHMSLHLKRTGRIHFDAEECHIVLVFHERSNDALQIRQYVEKVNQRNHKDINYETVRPIGSSGAWRNIYKQIIKIAPYATNVLLQGESGTGKDVVAKNIHLLSNRKGRFIAMNCGAFPKELLYSELFGYNEGAFTGAKKGGLAGKFECADGGTLFLDEICEMPLDLQACLLRAIESRTIVRFGSNKDQKVDVLIIAASNKSMKEMVEKGSFREDLYYRLNVIELCLPPLRERKEDIPLLVEHFSREFCQRLNLMPMRICSDAICVMVNYAWPGNVRELRNVIERALILTGGNQINLESLPEHIVQFRNPCSKRKILSDQDPAAEEAALILQSLKENDGNITKAAKVLRLSRVTLYRKIEKYKLDIKELR